LGVQVCPAEEGDHKTPYDGSHGGGFSLVRRRRKPAGWASGSLLVEAAISMSLLTVLGLTLLKLSLDVTTPRQWTLQQSITDAYLTFEQATAQRLPFDTLTGNQSQWPAQPNIAVTNNVVLGRLPGGRAITGSVTRTRYADSNNLTTKGGSGTAVTNPAGMEVWRFQSVIRYELGGRTYLKSRTVVRSQ
jgi:hypothetical protein